VLWQQLAVGCGACREEIEKKQQTYTYCFDRSWHYYDIDTVLFLSFFTYSSVLLLMDFL